VGVAQGGARPCPGRDPLARPAIAVGALSRGGCALRGEEE